MADGGVRKYQRRRKSLPGGSVTANTDKIDGNTNLNLESTEMPSVSRVVTAEPPPTPTVELDYFTQATKSLSFRPPYDSDEDTALSAASTFGPNFLPVGLRLTRHLSSHSGSGRRRSKSSTAGGSGIWADIEEYFRDLTVEDIERLKRGSIAPSLDVDVKSQIREAKETPVAQEEHRQGPVDEGTAHGLLFDKMLADPKQYKHNSANDSPIVEGELSRVLAKSAQITTHAVSIKNGEGLPNSDIHASICSTLMKANSNVLYHSASVRVNSCLEASSSSGHCCNNNNMQATSGNLISRCKGVNLDQIDTARNLGMLELSPADEVDGEIMYYQQRMHNNTITRKHMIDDLILKVGRTLPKEIDAARIQRWDAVNVSNYSHELKEAKYLGRKERQRKEVHSVLAAATATAAATAPSRASSARKDSLDECGNHEDLLKANTSNINPPEYSNLNPRVQDSIIRPVMSMHSFNGNSEPSDDPDECGSICEICRCSETSLNPVLVCLSCKVSVHPDCYCSVKSTKGPWQCELCDHLYSSPGSGAPATLSQKPNFVAECGLCGGSSSAFRKSVDGQWIHAFCAEWILESAYRRGQGNPIEGMERVNKGNDTCTLCHHKRGVCLKCSHGNCQSTFHPICARNAGLHMNVRTSSGELQHKAYCGKHSLEQQKKDGIEGFMHLKKERVRLEKLRLVCERIIKREKLKREIVIISHDILSSRRESDLSALAHHPFYQP